MLVLGIIVAVLVVISLIPVGIDILYGGDGLALSVKLGPAKLQILPAKEKAEETAGGKKKKKKKKKRKKKEKKEDKPVGGEEKGKKKRSFRAGDLLDAGKIVLKMLGRFRRALRVDVLDLRMACGASDPYDAVVKCGAINAAVGAALPQIHRAFRIRRQEIVVFPRFDTAETSLEAHFAATFRIGQIVRIVLCAGAAGLVWLMRLKRRARREAKLEKQSVSR